MSIFSTCRAARALALAGFAYAWPLATTISQAQIANELPAPPAGDGGVQRRDARSVLVPPAAENEAELPAPPALAPPALTPPAGEALAEPQDGDAARDSEVGRPAAYLGLIGDADGGGIRVLSVHEGGPAAEAGLKENDVITSVNGRKMASTEDMSDVISRHYAGDELRFDVRRGERPMQLIVTLGARISDEAATDADVGGATPNETSPAGRPRIGIHVATVTDALRAEYGVDFRAGALITAVGAGSPADRAGLPAGGVIFSIDGNPVEREEDVVNHIAASRWGQEIELGYRYNDEDYRKTVRLAPPAPVTASRAASGEARSDAGRPLTLRRRVLLPGGIIADGPAIGRIQRMIQAYGGPYIRFAPEVYVEEAPTVETPPVRTPSVDSRANDSRAGATQEELDRLRRRVTELEDELAAEKAATP